MAYAHKARPVSGEIMTGATVPTAAACTTPAGQADIVDADYEVVSSAAPCPHRDFQPAPLAAAIPAVEGMDMLRKPAATTAPGSPASRGGPVFWIAGIGAALAAFWVSGGDSAVRQAGFFTAARPNGAALTISEVKSRVDVSGANHVLFVDGEAANDGAGASSLPPLEIRVTGNDGRVTRYTLGTAGRTLMSGERFAFSSRLDLPKNGVRTVSVAFAE